jgi:ribosomal protein L17
VADVSLIDKLLEHGSMGIALAASWVVIARLWLKLDEQKKETAAVQEQRVQDSKSVAETLTKNNERLVTTCERGDAALRAQQEAFKEVEGAMREHGDLIKDLVGAVNQQYPRRPGGGRT